MGENKRNSKKYSHLLIEKCKQDLNRNGGYWHEQEVINLAHDRWDIEYGRGSKDFVVYVFTDGTRPGNYQYGPLTFNHQPFYVGEGRASDRITESIALGRQKDKYQDKVIRMKQIIEDKAGQIHWIVINSFYTEKKAKIVEKKLLQLIGRPPLTNLSFTSCEIPLKREDYFDPYVDGIILS